MSIYTSNPCPVISVHLPKCAGTSLQVSLKMVLGNQLLLDYGDRIVEITDEAQAHRRKTKIEAINKIETRKNVKIIHGHFYAAKYLDVYPGAKFITILRRPDALLMSYYNYLRSREDSNPLIVKAKSCRDFEEFIEIDWFQNIITKLVFPLKCSDFSYIGFLDDYQQGLAGYSKIIGFDLSEMHENKGVKERDNINTNVIQRLMELNAEDFAFYEAAMKNFRD